MGAGKGRDACRMADQSTGLVWAPVQRQNLETQLQDATNHCFSLKKIFQLTAEGVTNNIAPALTLSSVRNAR